MTADTVEVDLLGSLPESVVLAAPLRLSACSYCGYPLSGSAGQSAMSSKAKWRGHRRTVGLRIPAEDIA